MRVWMIAIVSCVCGLGCGDDDGGGGVSSGFPPSTMLSELSAEEVMQACSDLVLDLDVTLTAELDRVNCTLRAIPMSISVTLSGQAMGDPAMCRDLRDRCLGGENIGGADPVMVDPVGPSIQCGSPAAVTAAQSCDATVGEYEACLNAIVANAQSSLRMIDCSLVADPASLQDAMQPPPPPQPQVCAELDAQCPQLGIGGLGAGTTTGG
jgi:hypothetical protein